MTGVAGCSEARASRLGRLTVEARAALHGLLTGRSASVARGGLRDELHRAGWVIAKDGTLDPRAGILFGCDVGGTKTQSVLAELDGTILAEIKEPTVAEGGHAVIDQIVAQRRRLLAQAGVSPDRVLAASVGVPAAVHPRSHRLSRIPNIQGIETLDLSGLLAQALDMPVVVENDVNLAVQGEHWLGHSAESMVFIALGTGIGMGIILNGRLVRGARGAAGEISALPLGGDPFAPETLPVGALESVVSGKALLAGYEARGGAAGRSLRDLFADASDPAFAATVDELGRLTALAMLSVCAVIDPEKIVLGGSIGSRPVLLERTRHYLGWCMAAPPPCRISALGNRAGVLGAVRSARLLLAGELTPPRQG